MHKIFTGLLILFALLLVLYSAGWFWMAERLKTEIRAFYNETAVDIGIMWQGDEPVLSGYPFKPQVRLEGGFSINGLDIFFPYATISAFPFPNFPLQIDTPEGVQISHDQLGPSIRLDQLSANIIIPERLPQRWTQNSLRLWQAEQGTIRLNRLAIRQGEFIGQVEGDFGLDENLQPAIAAEFRTNDPALLIEELVKRDVLAPVAATFALTAINAIQTGRNDSGRNENSAERRDITLSLSLKNNVLSIGPVPLATLPDIVWPEENDQVNQPVQRQ